jgi:hypothetical protein
MADMALSAMDQLSPKSQSPSANLQRIEEAFDLAYKLVMSVLPQISQFNPRVAKDAHTAARTLLSARSEIRKDAAPDTPPDLMLGMGMAGSPGPLGPQPMSGGGGGGGGAY